MNAFFIILTRFGIGVVNTEALMTRLQILLTTIKPSLEQQTDPNFHWLVVGDANMSDDTRVELTKAICDRDNFFLSLVDPTKTLKMLPTPALFGHLARRRSSMVIVQRIDDDDVAHPEFVARTKTEYAKALERGSSLPIAMTFPRILEASLTTLQIVQRSYPWNQFSSTLSRWDSLYTPYHAGAHTRLGAHCAKRGGTPLVIDHHEAMYVYMRRPNSVSSIKKSENLDGARTFSSLMEMEVLSKYGLTFERRNLMLNFINKDAQSRPLFPPDPLKQIELKITLLDVIKKLGDANLSDARSQKAIIQAFYSV